MKKLFFITLSFALTGGSYAQAKKFVTLRVDIANRRGDVIYIRKNDFDVLKEIHVNPKGYFKDTLSIKEGLYQMFDGSDYTEMYLKNGYDLILNMDAKKIDKSILYKGIGEEENNYLAEYRVINLEFEKNNGSLFDANEEEFKKILKNKKAADLKRLKEKKLHGDFVDFQKNQINKSIKWIEGGYVKRKKS